MNKLSSRVQELESSSADGIVLNLYRTNYLASSVHAPDEARTLRDNQLDREEFRTLHEEFHSDSFAVVPRLYDSELLHWYTQIPTAKRVLTDGGDITYKRLLESMNETDLSVLLTVKASESDTVQRALNWLADTEITLIHEEYPQFPDTLDRLRILRSQFENDVGLADPAGRFERIESLFSHSPNYWIPCFRPLSEETGWTLGDLESIKEQLKSNRNNDSTEIDSLQLDERDQDYQRNRRRSLMADRSLTAGSTLSKDMIRELRPGSGVPAEEIDTVNGMLIQRPTDPQEIISY